MATTTNYGWTTPDDTALVKDGAAAIRTLGSSIDTSLNTALGTKKAGLVLLNTTSFSGVSSQEITGIFSATYTQYRIVGNFIGGTTATEVRGRFLSGTNTEYTGADHRMQTQTAENTTFSGTRFTGDTSFYNLTNVSTDNETLFIMEFLNPFQTAKKSIFTTSAPVASTTGIYTRITSHGTPTTTAFTGFKFIPVASTISGSISVYAYNK
jgi:hypothetical protein